MVGKATKLSAKFAVVGLKLWTRRAVPQIDKRLAEAAKLGFKQAVIPKFAAKGLPPIAGMEVMAVEKVDEALEKGILNYAERFFNETRQPMERSH